MLKRILSWLIIGIFLGSSVFAIKYFGTQHRYTEDFGPFTGLDIPAASWVLDNFVGSGTVPHDTNIYNTDGVLTGERTIVGNGYGITFGALGNFLVMGNPVTYIRSDLAKLESNTSSSTYVEIQGTDSKLYAENNLTLNSSNSIGISSVGGTEMTSDGSIYINAPAVRLNYPGGTMIGDVNGTTFYGETAYYTTGDMGINDEDFASKLYVDTEISAVDTIYIADGVLVGDRIIEGGSNNITWNDLTEYKIDAERFSVGSGSQALGIDSRAMGDNAIASGGYSTAIGSSAFTNGWNSIAMGRNSQALGSNSIAMGRDSIASGDYSTAFGNSSITHQNAIYSFVAGAFNLGKENSLFEIGNGSWGNPRSNIMTVYNSGMNMSGYAEYDNTGNMGTNDEAFASKYYVDGENSLYYPLAGNSIANPITGALFMGDSTGSYNVEVGTTMLNLGAMLPVYGPVIDPVGYIPGIGSYKALVTKGVNFFLGEPGSDTQMFISNFTGTFATKFDQSSDQARMRIHVTSGSLVAGGSIFDLLGDGRIQAGTDISSIINDSTDFITKGYLDNNPNNIYSNDGILDGNRTLNASGNSLDITNVNQFGLTSTIGSINMLSSVGDISLTAGPASLVLKTVGASALHSDNNLGITSFSTLGISATDDVNVNAGGDITITGSNSINIQTDGFERHIADQLRFDTNDSVAYQQGGFGGEHLDVTHGGRGYSAVTTGKIAAGLLGTIGNNITGLRVGLFGRDTGGSAAGAIGVFGESNYGYGGVFGSNNGTGLSLISYNADINTNSAFSIQKQTDLTLASSYDTGLVLDEPRMTIGRDGDMRTEGDIQTDGRFILSGERSFMINASGNLDVQFLSGSTRENAHTFTK